MQDIISEPSHQWVFFCYILPKFRYEKNEKQNTDPHLADMLKLIYAANIGWFQSLKSLKLKKKLKLTSQKLHFFTEDFCHLIFNE